LSGWSQKLYTSSSITGQGAKPLNEQAARFGKPLAFHIGADAYENSN